MRLEKSRGPVNRVKVDGATRPYVLSYINGALEKSEASPRRYTVRPRGLYLSVSQRRRRRASVSPVPISSRAKVEGSGTAAENSKVQLSVPELKDCPCSVLNDE